MRWKTRLGGKSMVTPRNQTKFANYLWIMKTIHGAWLHFDHIFPSHLEQTAVNFNHAQSMIRLHSTRSRSVPQLRELTIHDIELSIGSIIGWLNINPSGLSIDRFCIDTCTRLRFLLTLERFLSPKTDQSSLALKVLQNLFRIHNNLETTSSSSWQRWRWTSNHPIRTRSLVKSKHVRPFFLALDVLWCDSRTLPKNSLFNRASKSAFGWLIPARVLVYPFSSSRWI